jgi:hypothetical protein
MRFTHRVSLVRQPLFSTRQVHGSTVQVTRFLIELEVCSSL